MTNQKRPLQGVKPGNHPAGQISKEQIAAEHYRAYNQQMQSIAQAIMYNMLHALYPPRTTAEGKALVDRALEMAEYYMLNAGKAVEKAFEKQMALAEAEAEAKKKDQEQDQEQAEKAE